MVFLAHLRVLCCFPFFSLLFKVKIDKATFYLMIVTGLDKLESVSL